MNVPNFENTKFVERDGNLTAPWQIILQQLISEMQRALSNEGFIPPGQSSGTINDLQDRLRTLTLEQQKQYGGSLIYDISNRSLRVFIVDATDPTLSLFKTATLT
jgi:hypothetical protein